MKLVESFHSLQGEGKNIGLPTYFVRFGGCNLNCRWCDTRYAADRGEKMTVEEILDLCRPYNRICLTGGEPLLQEGICGLTESLLEMGKEITVETNGSMDVALLPDDPKVLISMDIKCPSSGMDDRMDFNNIPKLKPKDQLKFIIFDGKDLDFAVEVMDRYKPPCESIFSPVGGMDLEPLAEEILYRNLNVRLLPQLHKIIWGRRPGV